MFAKMLSISPSRMVVYDEWQGERRRSNMPNLSLENLKDNQHKGCLSKAAVKRMSNAIDWLLMYADKKKVVGKGRKTKTNYLIGFVTLTLSATQNHSDKVIKKTLLHQFLTEARWRWGVLHYVWKAERQKNGNIHFHLLTDKFIPYKELRDCWNRLQSKLGYISAFAENFGHCDPNSTDIHSVANVKNVSAYVKKYMAKHEDEESIQGNIWGLSYSLSKSKNYTMFMSEDVERDFDFLKNQFIERFKVLDYCDLLCVNFRDIVDKSKNKIVRVFASYVQEMKSLFNANQLVLKCV